MLGRAEFVGFIPVRDLESARRFYCATLGLEAIEETPVALVLEAGGAPVRLSQVSDLRPQPFTIAGWRRPARPVPLELGNRPLVGRTPMGLNSVRVEGPVGAPAPDVYRYIADMVNHHPHFLPPAFSDFRVVSGGVGDGTVTTFTFTAGGRTREFRMTATEPEAGRRLVEKDANSSSVTTFTVDPATDGTSAVTITTEWQGASGVGGFFERMFAPRVMRSIYADELRRLDAYAREQAASPAGSD